MQNKIQTLDDVDYIEMEMEEVGRTRRVDWPSLATHLGRGIMNAISLLGTISIGFVGFYVLIAVDSPAFLKYALIPQLLLGIALAVKAYIINGDK